MLSHWMDSLQPLTETSVFSMNLEIPQRRPTTMTRTRSKIFYRELMCSSWVGKRLKSLIVRTGHVGLWYETYYRLDDTA